VLEGEGVGPLLGRDRQLGNLVRDRVRVGARARVRVGARARARARARVRVSVRVRVRVSSATFLGPPIWWLLARL